MKITDFKITMNLKEIEADKFCCSCFKANPEHDAGYSSCCHEDVVNKDLALKFSKRRDILNFIKTKFTEAKEFGNLFFSDKAIFSFDKRLVYINVKANNEEILEELKCNI